MLITFLSTKGRSQYQSSDNEWYFFCPRNKKHANGSKINRANEFGYWKVSGRDRTISHGEQNLGMKKILVFYTGRPPRGARTSWVMHEYRLLDKDLDIDIQVPFSFLESYSHLFLNKIIKYS